MSRQPNNVSVNSISIVMGEEIQDTNCPFSEER